MTTVAEPSTVTGRSGPLPEGIWPIVSTPFTGNGEIDLAALSKLVRFLTTTGVSALTLFGFGSEAYKLADAERMQLLEVARESSGSLPLILTVNDHATQVAVERARTYASHGASALMVLPPYFQAPSVAARMEHIRAVAEATDLPLIVQVATPITGQGFPAADLAGLAATIPTLQYVKVEEAEPVRYVRALHELGAQRPRPVLGYGGRALPQLAGLGVHALQPGDALAEYYVRLWETRLDPASLRRLYTPVLEVQDTGGTLETLVVANKHLLMKRGLLRHDHCRAPTIRLEPEQIEWLEGTLRGAADVLGEGGAAIVPLGMERLGGEWPDVEGGVEGGVDGVHAEDVEPEQSEDLPR